MKTSLEIFDKLGLDWYYYPPNKNKIIIFLPDLKMVWIYMIQELIKNGYIIDLDLSDRDYFKKETITIFNTNEKIEVSIRSNYDFSVIPFFFHIPKGYY